ncbi:DnaB helicase C-terminal domain-containing protein [Staphylococcus haemolyticus]|uniref:DnaB helicase C-terminal domain-containing protein n=1 Tax=Staphylococcus haemolyticus TaxID=1283 RepID=UPI00069F773E|nr:DnaB helicase C-terminal domain-containing protein [Staphylococcus haemolyticus]MBE7332485.1 damage-inducible protein [Staphylococcus haemolyticus]MCH4376936.1 DnaB helicase C-terminal domain-containing protein [Staphylococcus haemolyticus]MDR5621877.1 DnaB helicase C-terminal domain-containing protein [Staphylococcus haemolyticus]MDU0441561.1 DnaB helicase C-terminal domain-containing protein [Staphylococcus haemolyticus]MDU0473679.1 DnaB helicase C-terminal domain-containing protein [Stap
MNERRDIESTIISSLLKKPELIEKLRVRPYMFYYDDFRVFMEYVFEVGKVDHQEIFLETSKNKNFLNFDTIQKLYNSDFIGYGIFERYQQNLLEAYQISQANEVINEFNQSPNMQSFEVMLTDLNQVSLISATDETSTKQIVDEFVEELYSDEPKKVIKTGFPLMDYKIGGLEPTQLVVIAARPSVGKTGFALQMMLNIAKQGYKTSLFSLETTGVAILERMLSAATGIELSRIKKKSDLSADDLTKLTSAASEILKLEIDVNSQSNVSTQEVRKQAMKNKDKQQVIFIDYLQLMQTDSKLDRRNGIEKISRDLKIIANETGAIIVLLSQLSRGVESRNDKRPMLSDMKEAGGIEADASLAMLLYRDDYYNQDEEDELGKSIVECNIAKNKDGETGVIEFEYYKRTQRFMT